MGTVVVIFAVTALMLGGFIAIPTGASGDEAFEITGEIREVKVGETRLQIIPTNKGVVIAVGELVKDDPANMMLLEGARTAQVTVAQHTHTKTLVVHRGVDKRVEKEFEDAVQKYLPGEGD